ncbi:hypothetical protein [Nitrobacter vulgaris]|uniref:Uncharacterized protein n=1 Tax=Nitrobacter vulgaris TaxID=29421 RepID=A0A1V4I0I7_NITVU|nr:hypothetical protein [Nitrobacter vulgaris]OPH83625.1 hypothetical protein B2M20_05565 [Nitrobacter vulgaris]
MKYTKQALQRYLQSRQESWASYTPLVEAPEAWIDQFDGIELGFDHNRRGRPQAQRSRNPRTFQSRQAAEFAQEEVVRFRYHFDTRQVPKAVRDEFIKAAMGFYPSAKDETVWDYLRMNRKRL